MDDQNHTAARVVAAELGVRPAQVDAVARLLDDGGTVPFISRYRKEATGSLDEVAVATIRDRLAQLAELDKRRGAIVSSLTERELLTDELAAALQAAATLSVLEDIYLPYRPKRRTRATIARERGLEPLARRLFAQDRRTASTRPRPPGLRRRRERRADGRRRPGRRARHHRRVGQRRRRRPGASCATSSRAAAPSAARWPAARRPRAPSSATTSTGRSRRPTAPSHRVLAMFRGEAEGFLRVRVDRPRGRGARGLGGALRPDRGRPGEQVRAAVHDGYRRLLEPSMETESRAELTERADAEAIRVFADNLRELLLAPPLGAAGRAGHRPGLPHRLQDGGARRPRAAAAQRDHPPASVGAAATPKPARASRPW